MIEAMTNPAQGTQMIDRTVLLLRLVATFCPRGARLIDLAVESGLPAPTVRRILKRLSQHGLIAQDEVGHRYSLGYFALELGLATNPARTIAPHYRPLIERLAEETKATVYLQLRSGLDSICIDRVDTATPSQSPTLHIGDRLPLGAGIGGLALLAELPEADQERIIEANASVYTRFVRTTGASFRDHLEAARNCGIVLRRSPVTPGIIGLGIALQEARGPATLAISLAFAASELPESRRAGVIEHVRGLVSEHWKKLGPYG